MKLYGDLRWRENFVLPNHKYALVDITSNITLFNYCIVDHYTPSFVEPLLASYNLTKNDKWIAYTTAQELNVVCNRNNWVDSYMLQWHSMLAPKIEGKIQWFNVLTLITNNNDAKR